MYYQQFHLAKDDFSLGPLISVLFNFFSKHSVFQRSKWSLCELVIRAHLKTLH